MAAQTASRISRAALQQRYPDARRFRKTDGNVALVDFGTTFCSLALSTAGNTEITVLPLNTGYSRVPTAILLKKTGNASASAVATKLDLLHSGTKLRNR